MFITSKNLRQNDTIQNGKKSLSIRTLELITEPVLGGLRKSKFHL